MVVLMDLFDESLDESYTQGYLDYQFEFCQVEFGGVRVDERNWTLVTCLALLLHC